MKRRLSKKELALLKAAEGCCRVSYTETSRKLGVSHTAVRKAIDKLASKGLLEVAPLLNVENLDVVLALLFLEVPSDREVNKILERFRECPRIISMFKTLGEYNVVALIYAEDQSVLDSILGSCMLRVAEGIRKSEVILVSSVLLGGTLHLKVSVSRRSVAPCGVDCYACDRFRSGKCVACPAVWCYTGWFSLRPNNASQLR